jgi:hypothetical protein
LAISKRGLPAPNTAKAKPPAKLADTSWIRAQFVDFTIVETLDESGAKVLTEEKITERDVFIATSFFPQ